MADEWCLVPAEATNEMLRQNGLRTQLTWAQSLSARPPIPRPVWDAMVERGARALGAFHTDRPFEHWGPNQQAQARDEVDAALRAALNNPRIEGDEGA